MHVKTYEFAVTTEDLYRYTAWSLFILGTILMMFGYAIPGLDATVAAVFFYLVPIWKKVSELETGLNVTLVIPGERPPFGRRQREEAPKTDTDEVKGAPEAAAAE